ncbi:MAG: septum formation protein Maf [Oscillospiraceae bacterium]|nr:septum formation protein Maf [Oscillospiraceae bacterium]
MQLILASQSPRRKTLMELFRIPFEIRVSSVDEAMDPAASPSEEVARVSRLKAEAIPHGNDDVVVAADTIVVCDGQVLGKPKDEEDAFRMLRMLSGNSHQVMTGMTVLRGSTAVVGTEVTDIRFRPLSDEEILSYIRTGEPMDKAGAYGIQGGAALFAEGIVGDYYNVMGLPVCRLGQILREIAPELMEDA